MSMYSCTMFTYTIIRTIEFELPYCMRRTSYKSYVKSTLFKIIFRVHRITFRADVNEARRCIDLVALYPVCSFVILLICIINWHILCTIHRANDVLTTTDNKNNHFVFKLKKKLYFAKTDYIYNNFGRFGFFYRVIYNLRSDYYLYAGDLKDACMYT